MDQSVEFGLFVRSVEGHAVPRYGTTELIGARRDPVTKKTKRAGSPAIVWSDRIVGLTKQYCSRYTKELQQHIAEGELLRCTREEWDAQRALELAAEKAAKSEAKTNTDEKSGKVGDK